MATVKIVSAIIVPAIDGQAKSSEHVEHSRKDYHRVLPRGYRRTLRVTPIEELWKRKRTQVA